eukprot:scaffold56582_cov21-Prasinocladus_malaysianus.AAC.1
MNHAWVRDAVRCNSLTHMELSYLLPARTVTAKHICAKEEKQRPITCSRRLLHAFTPSGSAITPSPEPSSRRNPSY